MTIGKLSGQCDFGQKGQSYCNQRGQSCVAKRVKVAWLFQWATDVRSKNMIFPALEVIPVSAKWYVYSKNPDVAEHLKISPVIRLTEMNYILAECHARNGNYGEAYGILNNIRAGRQLDRLAVGNSWEEFLIDLIGDARREWISEGQLFFLYKRLDAAFNLNGEMHKLTRGEASLPLPKDQK